MNGVISGVVVRRPFETSADSRKFSGSTAGEPRELR